MATVAYSASLEKNAFVYGVHSNAVIQAFSKSGTYALGGQSTLHALKALNLFALGGNKSFLEANRDVHKLVSFTLLIRKGSDGEPEYLLRAKAPNDLNVSQLYLGLERHLVGEDLAYHNYRDGDGDLIGTQMVDLGGTAVNSSARALNESFLLFTGPRPNRFEPTKPVGMVINTVSAEFLGKRSLGVLFIQGISTVDEVVPVRGQKTNHWLTMDALKERTVAIAARATTTELFTPLSLAVIESIDAVNALCKELLKPAE